MPLPTLATLADLPDHWASSSPADIERALEVASSVIRDAAEHPISATAATVVVTGGRAPLLRLPAPLSAVTAVEIDGEVVTDYSVLPEGLWRVAGWGGMAAVQVSATFGYSETPADVVDLCAQLAASWLAHAANGGGSTAGLASVRIDDAAETYTAESSETVSPVFLPPATRQWLRARFGGTVTVIEVASS